MPLFHTKKGFLKAAETGDIALLKEYLAMPGNKWCEEAREENGATALYKAAEKGHVEAVKILLAQPVTGTFLTDGRGWYGMTLNKTVTNGHEEVVRALLSKEEILNKSHEYPISEAISSGRLDILKDFVATGNVDFTACTPPALYDAARHNKPEILTYLLGLGADPNVPFLRPENWTEMPREECLSAYVWSANPRPASPLYAAVASNNADMAAELLRHGARPAAAELLLHQAVLQHNQTLVTLLLAAKMGDLAAANAQGETVLHLAVQKDEPGMVTFLLRLGADPLAADKKGVTPLTLAQRLQRADIVRVLDDCVPFAPAPLTPALLPAVPDEEPPASATVAREVDVWALPGKNRLTHTYELPSRRLTEVFNFDTRERVVFCENTTLKTETMGPHESFDTLSEEAIGRAAAEFRHLGGTIADSDLGRNRLAKLKVSPT